MIRGIHAMFYTSEAEALRAFLRDKLGLRWADTGGGWLIFEAPGAEIGCHPVAEGKEGGSRGTHTVSFYCDDLPATMAELKTRGVEFLDEIRETEYGFVTNILMPGGVTAQLYQPKYTLNYRPGLREA